MDNVILFVFIGSSIVKPIDKLYAMNLVIPTRFSAETTACVKSGKLSKKARDEIINSLSTMMLVHTSRPSPEDFTVICSRLVEKYPTLRDTVDNGFVKSQ